MRTVVGRASLSPPEGGTAVTIGTFDGVHIGHRSLIARTLARAGSEDLVATALTWDRHPAATLRPDKRPPLLTSPERKVELMSDTGLDLLAISEFDLELSRWSPDEFVDRIIVSGLGAQVVVVGEGWRFGHKARGDTDLLQKLGAEAGFATDVVPLAEVSGGPASSTRAREALAGGDLELARALLGRPFDVDGVVVRGAARGASLGWPTANLEVDPDLVLPGRGVYAGRARAGDRWWKAAINVGVNPTFGGTPDASPLHVEAYLLDYTGDLYGERLRVEFHERLRDEIAFESERALSDQIARDVELARRLTC